MREVNNDVATVASKLAELSPHIPGFGFVDPAWSRPPAVLVIDCVLSLNRRYDGFVVPRLETFMQKHPGIQRAIDLTARIDRYPTPHAFMQQELNYNHEERANTLQSVAQYVCTIVEEAQTIEEEKALLKQ